MVVLNTGERLKYLRRLKPALVARVCAARNCLPESVDIEVPMPPRRKKQPAPIAEDPAPLAVEEEVPSIEEKTEWEPAADVRGFPDGVYLSTVVQRKRIALNL